MIGACPLQAGSTTSILDAALAEQRRLWPYYPLDRLHNLDRQWRQAEAFLVDQNAIDALLASQSRVLPGLDLKGRAAFAIGAYTYALATAMVPLFVGFRLVPHCWSANLAISFAPTDRSGIPRIRFALTRAAIATAEPETGLFDTEMMEMNGEALCDHFGNQLESHMRTLIENLHASTHLGRGALWRLVADYFAQLFLDAGARFDRSHRARADAIRILKRPGSPLANRQMHFFDLALREEQDACSGPDRATFLSRGGCCRQYTVEGYGLCANCVLQPAAIRDHEMTRSLAAAGDFHSNGNVEHAGSSDGGRDRD